MSGSASLRPDALAKALGTAKYSGDFNFPGMLYAKALWPEQVPVRIERIDISAAECLPGVVRIITRQDITGTNRSGIYEPYDRPVLVGEGEEAKFMLDALALVVAEREDIAERALRLIRVEYQALPGLYTLEQAQEQNMEAYQSFKVDKGDVEPVFAAADLVVEEDYSMPYLEHVYLEPEAGYSYMDGQGVINVCFGSQNLARHHRTICKSLGIPHSRVRLSLPYVGGGFGGKHALTVQIYLALIGSIVRTPVKMIWTREESFRGGKRHAVKGHSRMAFDRNGKLEAIDIDVIVAAAPYMAQTPQTLKPVVSSSISPYAVEDVRVRGKAYQLNNVESVAFRGFGWTEGTMMVETLMSKAAKALGLDEAEIRRRNVLPREKWQDHFTYFKSTLHSRNTQIDTIDKVIAAAGSKPVIPGKKVGRGLASAECTFEFGNTPGYKGTGADIIMFSDGSVTARIGFPEIGQGITAVVITLISDYFSIPGENINLVYGDSALTPKAGSLGASRGTVNIGNAVLDACEKLKKMLEKYAGEMLDTTDVITFRDGVFYRNADQAATFTQIMDYCYIQGKNLCANGWYEGDSKVELKGFTFISGLVDVAVDELSGDVEILQFVICHDAGKIIYHDGALGQIYGGAVMALGGILYEDFSMSQGKPRTSSLAEYIIPTTKDLPLLIKPLFVEVAGEYGPKGAKGMGEHVLHTAPAIVNAIYDATGMMITELPITPEKILRYLGKI